jgi:hypothetical protein
VRTFDDWFEGQYYTAIQMRDWQTADYLMDYAEHLERGYNAALNQEKDVYVGEYELHADGVKVSE